MNDTPTHNQAKPRVPRLAVSPDGYVRLTAETFRTIPLHHLLSELDAEERSTAGGSGACAASIVGFTEWSSRTTPALSLGWDWQLNTLCGSVHYARDGEVRSNVMLIDRDHNDIGAFATGVLLCAAVDQLAWQSAVADYITDRYACHLSTLTVTRRR